MHYYDCCATVLETSRYNLLQQKSKHTTANSKQVDGKVFIAALFSTVLMADVACQFLLLSRFPSFYITRIKSK